MTTVAARQCVLSVTVQCKTTRLSRTMRLSIFASASTKYGGTLASFSQLLSSFEADPDKRGKQFERFVKWFLTADPEWSTQVAQVWLWNEYPGRWGRDCGIDLVFKHKNGQTWAVQAKCYSPTYEITKPDVDKFLSEIKSQRDRSSPSNRHD